MKNSTLKVIRNEFKTTRVLPEQKPKPLSPPKFEIDLIDFHNPGVKWFFGLEKII